MNASIDIGTNTVLLLVAEAARGELTVFGEQQRIPRLGAGVDESKVLSKNAMQRVVASLKEFQRVIEVNYPEVDDIFVTATSAVRDAKNRAFFIDLVRDETGLQIQVLSGVEEAEHTFLGAKSVLNNIDGPQMVIDIGGGSTEIAYGQKQLLDRFSYDMGCVRFTERFLKSNPPTDLQIQTCRTGIREVLEEHKFDIEEKTKLIGVAGTVTSLAFIDLNLTSYDPDLISGHIITQEKLENIIREFCDYSSNELEQKYPSVMKGRADIFMAGLLILDEFMNEFNFEELITSTGGIRHGTLITRNKK